MKRFLFFKSRIRNLYLPDRKVVTTNFGQKTNFGEPKLVFMGQATNQITLSAHDYANQQFSWSETMVRISVQKVVVTNSEHKFANQSLKNVDRKSQRT